MRGINITNSWTAVSEGNPSCPSHQRDSSTVCSHDDTDTESALKYPLLRESRSKPSYHERLRLIVSGIGKTEGKYLIESVLESERTQWLGTQMNRHCGIRGETPEQYWIWEQSWVHYAAPFQGTFTFHFPPTFQNRLQKSWLVWQAWGT